MLFPSFSFIRFCVPRLIVTSFIHLALHFVQGNRHESISILHINIQWDQNKLLRMLCFLCIVLASMSKTVINLSVFYVNAVEFFLLYLCNRAFFLFFFLFFVFVLFRYQGHHRVMKLIWQWFLLLFCRIIWIVLVLEILFRKSKEQSILLWQVDF